MCDFEDMDLNQVRPARHKREDREQIDPEVSAGKSMEELREEEIVAENQEIYKGGENE